MRRIVIHGINPIHSGYIADIHDWQTEQSITELKSLLTDQEALVKRSTSVSLKSEKKASSLKVNIE